MKKRSKKGFTLAELLIVIAIIAVLVAIMFPVFGAQLDKARAAAELSNVRAKYAELVADAMLGGNDLTEPVTTIEIRKADLKAACNDQTNTVIVYTDGDSDSEQKGKIKVTYKGNYEGSFETDPDVTFVD